MLVGIFEIVLGSAFLIGSVVIKKFFWSRTLRGAALSDRPFPAWAGRIIFVTFGLIMVAAGIKGMIAGK
jgi:predicted phage tail protein